MVSKSDLRNVGNPRPTGSGVSSSVAVSIGMGKGRAAPSMVTGARTRQLLPNRRNAADKPRVGQGRWRGLADEPACFGQVVGRGLAGQAAGIDRASLEAGLLEAGLLEAGLLGSDV